MPSPLLLLTLFFSFFSMITPFGMPSSPATVTVPSHSHISLPPTGIASSAILTLYRFKLWWARPHFPATAKSIKPATFLILTFNPHTQLYHLLLPDPESYFEPTNEPTNEPAAIQICPLSSSTTSSPTCTYFSSSSPDPYALLKTAAQTLCPLASYVNPIPLPLPGLGWCTWNSFYTALSPSKILAAVTQLPMTPNWILIDDGWQHTSLSSPATAPADGADGAQWGAKLAGLAPDPHKFPNNTLKDLITALRDLKVSKVIAWHTIGGYWTGVSPDLKADYPSLTAHTPDFPPSLVLNDPTLPNELSIPNKYTVPKETADINKFYADYHSSIAGMGFDGVKVDAQAVANVVSPSPLLQLHSAKHSSSLTRFSASIECMCHDPRILFNLGQLNGASKPIIRASDDFYPDDEPSHAAHIRDCAFNSLLIGLVGIADWDMFTTANGSPALNGLARSVSGGPIYISDNPAEPTDTALLSRTLGTPCLQSLLPVRESLFSSPAAPDLLRLFNENRCSGVVFAANVFGAEWSGGKYAQTTPPKTLSSTVSPRMIESMRTKPSGARFLCWRVIAQIGEVLEADGELTLTLEEREAEIVSVSDFKDGIACIGFINKFNAAGAVVAFSGKVISLGTVEGERFAVAVLAGREIMTIKSNGKELRWEAREGGEGFEIVEISVGGGDSEIEIA